MPRSFDANSRFDPELSASEHYPQSIPRGPAQRPDFRAPGGAPNVARTVADQALSAAYAGATRGDRRPRSLLDGRVASGDVSELARLVQQLLTQVSELRQELRETGVRIEQLEAAAGNASAGVDVANAQVGGA
jgi:hypothetical protein